MGLFHTSLPKAGAQLLRSAGKNAFVLTLRGLRYAMASTPSTATPSPHERQHRAFAGAPIRRSLGTPGLHPTNKTVLVGTPACGSKE